MDDVIESFRHLTDEQLLAETRLVVARERTATTVVVAALAEVDARALYASLGYSSLYTYCTGELHLSEKESESRIRAARVGRDFPVALDLLAEGRVTLTNLNLLAPHLTPSNHVELLHAAQFKTRREVEQQIGALYPGRPRLVSWHVRVSPDTDNKLQRARDLLRHVVPDGDVAKVLDRALTHLIEHLEKKKLGAVSRPRRARPVALGSRHVPAHVKREVLKRDEGRCTFVGASGRCAETAQLEFHHADPFAYGGAATVENIRLRCRTHNQYEAERDFPREPQTQAPPTPSRSQRSRSP
jgi:hypothetical protein